MFLNLSKVFNIKIHCSNLNKNGYTLPTAHRYTLQVVAEFRGGICPCRQCRGQCKIFASGVNFSIFTHLLCFFLLKLLKLGEIDGVKFLARKSGGVKFWTNSMSG